MWVQMSRYGGQRLVNETAPQKATTRAFCSEATTLVRARAQCQPHERRHAATTPDCAACFAQRSGLQLSQHRTAPFEVLSFPADSIDRFISDDGRITIDFDDLQVVPLHDE